MQTTFNQSKTIETFRRIMRKNHYQEDFIKGIIAEITGKRALSENP